MRNAQPRSRNDDAGGGGALARMRYGAQRGSAFLSGIQALARLPIDQRRLDIRCGRDTAGFVSGYRGSPLGGLDSELWRQSALLDELGVVFQPGVNEDLAATAVWGTQQVGLFPGAKHEGVFGLWYGKAPGVDRSSDALRHANAAGTSPLGGVLLAVGDDPGCKSSTLPSASEFALRDLGIPVLAPANVQEVLDFGLFGWALSRHAGCWAALLAVTDVMDSAMTVDVDLDRHAFASPAPPEGPGPGRESSPHIRLADSPLEQEARWEWKLRLATAFAAAGGIDRLVTDPAEPRLVVVSAGKVYADVREALAKLGFATTAAIAAAGVRLVKLGMTWPLNAAFVENACRGAGRVLVVEQKRAFVEEQLRALLFGTPAGRRVEVIGKTGGRMALPATGELDAKAIATALARALATPGPATVGVEAASGYLAEVRRADEALADVAMDAKEARLPVYCPGCPHNLSTRVPAGSRAGAGIGCHYMAQWMGRNTHLPTHMGAEGANWIGQAPFTNESHIFVNLGDGTYFHSGLLAIRAAVAAGVNVTYKILANDAVAMTGGQKVDGELTVADIVAQVTAEGVADVRVVADDPRRHRRRAAGWGLWNKAAPAVAPREDLQAVQRELRATPGCTVLVYDQTCAAELRRRRRRGLGADPDVRVVINDAVCEGCGDCSAQSSCAAIEPLATELGVKRAINQTACNKDLSCLAGFCPAMVTLTGARPRRAAAKDINALRARLPLPAPPRAANVLIAGVGGTGVVTVSQLLGTAAHLDGKFVSTLDATGLAQKGGAVVSHVRISPKDAPHAPTRIAAASADVLIAADQVTAAGRDVLALLSPNRTLALVNEHVAPTAAFVLAGEETADAGRLRKRIRARVYKAAVVDAQAATKEHFGVATGANVFLLGHAFQRGTLPASLAALEQAIKLNGVDVADNLAAFHLGRAAALDEDAAGEQRTGNAPTQALLPQVSQSLEERIAYRRTFLAAYQDEALAAKYEALVRRARAAERRAHPGSTAFAEAVADSYFRLLAVKDEYEVARLFVAGGGFDQHLATQFAGRRRLTYHFAPSWFGRRDADGRTRKIALPSWLAQPALRTLASLRTLRGGPFDVFRHTAERQLERSLRARFEADFQELCRRLTAANLDTAVAFARLPATIKGFGPIKEAAARVALGRRDRLALQLFAPQTSPIAQGDADSPPGRLPTAA